MSADDIALITAHFQIIDVVLQLKQRGRIEDAKYIQACAELTMFALHHTTGKNKRALLIGAPHFQNSAELWGIVCSTVSNVLSSQEYERAVHQVSNSALQILAEEAVKVM